MSNKSQNIHLESIDHLATPPDYNPGRHVPYGTHHTILEHYRDVWWTLK